MGMEDWRLTRNTYLMAFSQWVGKLFNSCKPKASLSNPQEGDPRSVSRGRGRGRSRVRGRGRGLPADVLGMGDDDGDGGTEEEAEEEKVAVMCWICKVQPSIKKFRSCKECKQDWDCFEKDAKRKKEHDYLKEFKKRSTEDQVRRLFFAWKKCRMRSSTGISKCIFPWAAVHRSWAIRKCLTEGKGGKMKVYHSFCKHYVEKKGWSMVKADQHWQKRLSDRSWRHGVDPEDTIASIWISGTQATIKAASSPTLPGLLSLSLFLSSSVSFSLPFFLALGGGGGREGGGGGGGGGGRG